MHPRTSCLVVRHAAAAQPRDPERSSSTGRLGSLAPTGNARPAADTKGDTR